MKNVIVLLLIIAGFVYPQVTNNHLTVIVPERDTTITYGKTYRLSGNTLPGAKLFLDNDTVHVYPSGAFGGIINVAPDTVVHTLMSIANGDTVLKRLTFFRFKKEYKKLPVDVLAVDSTSVLPSSNLWLNAGEVVRFTIRATPGCEVYVCDSLRMNELDLGKSKVEGVYQLVYKIKVTDNFSYNNLKFTIINDDADTLIFDSPYEFKVLTNQLPVVGRSKNKRTALNYELGTNRLGGAKMQFVDEGILLNIDGRNKGMYRVKLAPGKHAWVSEDEVVLTGSAIPAKSLTGTIVLQGEENTDIISLNLSRQLPYSSFVQLHPTKIFVDVYGAFSNTNWLVNKNTAKNILSVDYLQVSDGIFRIIIEPEDQQLWGYSISYSGNNLIIRVKREPEDLDVDKLTFVIDAGHGGNNNGALGSTGLLEKDVNLSIAKHLRDLLVEEGAKVYLTRDDDYYISNSKRLLNALEINPDMLISIHSNSIGLTTNPLDTKGTAAFYKHIEYRKLAEIVHNHVLETGLDAYGFVGKFNFTLNSETEFPNVLVETAFMSNPEDEMKLMDDEFRREIAEKILEGVEDYLDYCEDN